MMNNLYRSSSSGKRYPRLSIVVSAGVGNVIFMYLTIVLFLFVPVLITAKPTVEQLKTGSFEQRIEAIKYFGRVRYKKVFWELVKYLNKDFNNKNLDQWSIQFRKHAAEALGRLQDDRAIGYLVTRYKREKEVEVKQSIVYALSFYHDKTIPEIIMDALSSSDQELRLEALHASAKIQDTQFIPRIESIKKTTKVYTVYLASCYALVSLNFDTEMNYRQVQKGLSKADPESRFLSAYYLKNLGKKESIAIIEKALEIENYFWVRKEMEDALLYLRKLNRKKDRKRYKYYFPK